MPAKLLPPPAQPKITSGDSPAMVICLIVSSPITLWCRHTWFKTLPSAYFVPGCFIVSSIASLIAMPRLPLLVGSSARILRPNSVSMLGLAWTVAP